MMFQLNLKAAVFGAVILAASSAQADAISVDFGSFTAGALPGNSSFYDGGKWSVPNNARTYGTVKDGIGLSGGAWAIIGAAVTIVIAGAIAAPMYLARRKSVTIGQINAESLLPARE